MKYIVLFISLLFTNNYFACVLLSDKLDTDGFVVKSKYEKEANHYSVYFPSEIRGAKASYAYIYLEEDGETLIATSSQVVEAYDLYEYSEALFKSHKSINLILNEKYNDSVTIHVHYERPAKTKYYTVNCGPMRRYKFSALPERTLQ